MRHFARASTMSVSSRSPDLPRLGPRGEGWVAIQLALIALVPLSALTGVYWPEEVAGVLTVVGIVLLLVGLAFLLLAFARLTLARAMTVFPKIGARLEALGLRGAWRTMISVRPAAASSTMAGPAERALTTRAETVRP